MNKNSLKVIRYRIRLKVRLIEYKGGKCEICGYSKPVSSVYHFHHRDPKTKEFNISGCTLGMERLKAEVDKCDLLCANCHAETHDKEWSDNRVDILDIGRIREPKQPRFCKHCSCSYVPKRKEQEYCSRACTPQIFKAKT